ncbi:MAG: 1-deoxy-D-xylulose-5-phosphate reductoisomerase [Muribaculaceae bacterium]|nr:1-deoxy-D-xylulose-5-phosphate reductoisomerase [Muribaculaceae bacterium]
MTSRKKIAILGSTGSIGTQTLDIIAEYPGLFEVGLLVAGSNVDLLIQQAIKFTPRHVIIADDRYYSKLSEALSPRGIKVASGARAIADAMYLEEIDTVVTATVGYSGLEPTINAIKAGKRIALANKETLVVAGELITSLLKTSSSDIIPVDSEHSAIYQCLAGEASDSVKKLIITASGGPFRTKSMDELRHVTVKDALNHPNWSMGAKITIDSATMLNKAFEIIEARWLFGIKPENIEAVVHPQSIIHSMVEFIDGAVKAQLGLPDMHLPIRYALGDTTRLATTAPALTLADYSTLTFEAPDTGRFPCINLAYHALSRGGNTACIINAANEIAVAAFLHERIGFLEIKDIIESSLARIPFIASPTYDDYVNTNAATREYAESLINNKI